MSCRFAERGRQMQHLIGRHNVPREKHEAPRACFAEKASLVGSEFGTGASVDHRADAHLGLTRHPCPFVSRLAQSPSAAALSM